MKQIKIKIRNHYESVQFNYRTINIPNEINIEDRDELTEFLTENELLEDRDNVDNKSKYLVENIEGKEYVESDNSFEII